MKEMAIDTIAQFIYQRSRLSFTGHKKAVLGQRLEERMIRLGLPDLASYWNYVKVNPQEVPLLLDLLTTNETFFFRNVKQFEYLRQRIIPLLEEERGQEVIRSWGNERQVSPQSIMKLRILCAGCSTGEEPYSVAMTLLDALKYPKAWDIEILAGDLSESCIAHGAAGYYENARLKGLPPKYIDTYMDRTVEGATVRDEVKALIRFCCLNLGDIINGAAFPGVPHDFAGFDIIFCRNVMIYFSAEAQQQLVDALSRSLLPRGFLFTGDAEPLHLYDHELETVHEAGCLIYRKTETRKDVLSV
jgi:chemotaxis protein methyltransferase CheR